ncbi:MAG: hypothetical protein LBG60_06830 [Bifidobacteriaceae bacterium]|jgi:hypothetical protein|nr:hypothetical protein [Bifidobacteriaceae bacterium]
MPDPSPANPQFSELLASAARFQRLVPESVMVGGAAAALHASHRISVDHDHVLSDLSDRFAAVLEALEREGDWVTNRVTPGRIVLGELGGIETGLRQLIRRAPLETEVYRLPDGSEIVIPTLAETLRIKAFLAVKRNQVRDYLDIAALAATAGIEPAGAVLAGIDAYYSDQAPTEGTVAAQLAAQLADPQPKDSRTTKQLAAYKGLAVRWHDWRQVKQVCRAVAGAMLTADPP